jgi:NAD(P)-dependent dehydrogenase (short-subunit alcohol dehydrogenase family)
MRILVLGGYGNFGARICRALANGNLEVIAAGRDPDRGHSEALFSSHVGKARLDINDADLVVKIRRLSPDIVIHCVGPFQGQDYHVAKASLTAGAHYIDLADGRAFVCNFSAAVDPVALTSGLLAVTGASTLPALSSAVLDSLRERFTSMEDIQISIAPAQRTPRGAATIRAVLSYLGRPFRWLDGGVWQEAYGWQELKRMRFVGLGTRWAAACDVPDLELLPSRYPGVKTLQFRAALELGVQHLLLSSVAELHRRGIPMPLERFATQLDRVASWLNRFGSDRGGMLVSVTGQGNDGRRRRLDWNLTASDNHGPEIPCMAAILLANKLAHGDIVTRGGMPCVGMLSLNEFLSEFSHWGIETSIEEVLL